MMKFKKSASLVLAVILALMFTVTAFAAPYQNYTVTEGGVYSDPQAYTPDKVINSGYIGVENLDGKAFSNPQDLTQFDGKGYILVSDTDNNRVVVLDKDIRTVKQIIYGFTKNGVEETFNKPNGLFVHEEGKYLYVCDTENKRIVRYSFNEAEDKFVFDRTFDDPDLAQYFKDAAQGATNTTAQPTPLPTVAPDTETENNENNDATQEEPIVDDSEIEIDNSGDGDSVSSATDITYRPLKVVVDSAYRMFVVSKNCYRGLVELSDDGEFTKFFGATKTKQTLSALLNRLFTEKAKDKLQANLSTEYSNITIDKQGFVYGTISQLKVADLISHFTAATEVGAALRKLNAAGSDVLKRTGIIPPSGDNGDGINRSTYSFLCDVTVSENGLTSVLDSQKGRVFTYTSTGELLYVFGALGKNKTTVGETTSSRADQVGYTEGTNLNPVAIELLTDDETILILDSTGAQITTYKPTEYGLILRDAVNSHEERRYDDAVKAWNKILGMSSNSALAYKGVGKVYYLWAAETEVVNNDTSEQREKFLEAADYFMKGYSQEEYGKAFYKYRDLVLEKAMPYIMWAIIIITVVTLVTGWYKKFKKFVETGGRNQ
ncbi:MAG: hypothetical protein E7365_06425 [Clostridiales bacterium]|nr:hypothetical protein [Clostridiales bacterium]